MDKHLMPVRWSRRFLCGEIVESIGFVILTWNSEKYIGNCLKAVQSLNHYRIKIIVVDNGSDDNTIKEIVNLNSGVIELIQLTENRGTTISRNIGIERVMDCNYVCILDSDTIVNQIAMDKLLEILKERKENAIAGPRMMTSDGVLQNSGRRIPTITEKILKVLPVKCAKVKAQQLEKYEDVFEKDSRPVGYLMSACWLIKKEVLEKIGLLDEKIFYAPEDVEYCIRVWENGYRVIYCNEVYIIHEWQRLSRKKLFSKHNYEHIKGLLYLYKKYHFCFNAGKIESKVR